MSAHTLFRDDKSIGFMTSFLFHAALFAAGGFIFVQPIQYAVELGSGGVEVSLTAAPVEQASMDLEEMVQIPEPKVEIEEKPKQVQTAVSAAHKGDGSSAIPGKDSTTFYSAGGAIVEAKPNYLKNPAPPYPW